MFGTRDCFGKSDKVHKTADLCLKKYSEKLKKIVLDVKSPTIQLASDSIEQQLNNTLQEALQEVSEIFYLRRFYQQAKQLSQIIAYIWRWIDVDGNPKQKIAQNLKEYFIRPTEDNQDIGGNLEKLLAANPREDKPEKNVDEAKLLREVFPNYKDKYLIFPILSELERGEDGSGLGYSLHVDINSYQGNLSDTSINHPYLFIHSIPFPPRPPLGQATVTLDELESWVENSVPDQYYADNPYIPTTSS